jgi:hypothetical protein
MADLPRAYLKFEGRWCHVYILNRYEQMTLSGRTVAMATVKLVKNSKETYDVEARRLEAKRPRTPKKHVTSLS